MPLVVVRKADPTGPVRTLTALERRYLEAFQNAIAMVEQQLREQAVLQAIGSRNPARVMSAIDWAAISTGFANVPALLVQQITEAANATLRELSASVGMRFDMTNPLSIAWAEQRAGRLIAQITEEQRQLVRSYVADAVRGGFTVDQTAARLESVVGLHDRWARAVDTNYQSTFAQVLEATGDPVKAASRATEVAMRYRDRLVTSRARTIARTEIVQAHNRGRFQAWGAAADEGLVDPLSQKEWIATDDERTCEICGPLDGERVLWNEPFSTGDDMPDAHPNCRCTATLLPPDRSQTPAPAIEGEPGEPPPVAEPEAVPIATGTWADMDPATRMEAIKSDFDQVWAPVADKHGLSLTDEYTQMNVLGSIVHHREYADAAGNTIKYRRTITGSNDRAIHNYFTMSPALQGSGIATEVNTAAFDLYRARGLKTVTVHANIDVGGYTWAKQGFVFDRDEYTLDRLRSLIVGRCDLGDALADTPQVAALWNDLKASVRSARSMDELPTPLDIAMIGYEPGLQKWPGKQVMLGSDWQGILHL